MTDSNKSSAQFIPLSQKIEGAIRWGAIGDALWLAVEMKTKEEISENFWDLREYIPIKHNIFLAKAAEKASLDTENISKSLEETGIISDDTIFTMAWMHSITETWKINIQHIFDTHKNYFDTYGEDAWFGSITSKNFKTYTWDIKNLHSTSRWNGVMMKQFPYAAYLSEWAKKAYDAGVDIAHVAANPDDEILRITQTTHDTPIAKLTSLFHQKMLISLLNSQPEDFDIEKKLQRFIRIAPFRENQLCIHKHSEEESTPSNPDHTIRITPIFQKLLKQYKSIQAWKPYSYQQILDEYIVHLDESTDPLINKKMKPWFHVASTFGIVYACFLQNPNFAWLLDAIKIWYDTDTQWAIIGNMIWALHGPFYDQKYINWIKEKETIQKHIDDFKHAVEKIEI